MFKPKGPIIAGLILMFFGTIIFTRYGLYDYIAHADKMFHFFGGAVVAWYFKELWKDKLKAFNRFEQAIIYMSCVALVGVGWELLEYSTSLPVLMNLPTLNHYLYIGSITDTMIDLIVDISGAAAVSLLNRSRS